MNEIGEWVSRGDKALRKLMLHWGNYKDTLHMTPAEQTEYWRKRALALEALCVQQVDGADFYP